MVIEIMAALILLGALLLIGGVVFSSVGSVIGGIAAKDEKKGMASGAWIGLLIFWVVLLIVSLVVLI